MCSDFGIGPEYTLDILKNIFSLDTSAEWSKAISALVSQFSIQFEKFEYASLGLDLALDESAVAGLDQARARFGMQSRSCMLYMLLLIFNRNDVLTFYNKLHEEEAEVQIEKINSSFEEAKNEESKDEDLYFVRNSDVMLRSVTDKNAEEQLLIPKAKRQHICSYCNKQLSSKTNLKAHIRIHTGECPFVCEQCNRGFKQKIALQDHLKTHQEPQFGCKYCSQKFTLSHGLKEHEKVHSGERPFLCDFAGCTKQYSRSTKLNAHKKTHLDTCDYKCDFCSKEFKKWSSKDKHERIHRGDKRYMCNICDKAFYTSYNVKVHQKVHQRDDLKKSRKQTSKLRPVLSVPLSIDEEQ